MAEDEVLAVLEASAIRRWVGLGTVLGTAVLILWMSLTAPAGPLLQGLGVVSGAAVIWIADLFRRATAQRIELTAEGLFESGGVRLVRLDEIRSVERGMLAFKPSNGFVVHVDGETAPAWRPGMWWRFGTRVGVGGVTPVSQARFMADRLAELVAARS